MEGYGLELVGYTSKGFVLRVMLVNLEMSKSGSLLFATLCCRTISVTSCGSMAPHKPSVASTRQLYVEDDTSKLDVLGREVTNGRYFAEPARMLQEASF